MRDRNLSYQQFYIQLERFISSRFNNYGNERNYFSQELSLELRPSESNSEFCVAFPKDYHSLRTLSIILWYLPKTSHFLLRLALEESTLSWLNWKQQVEISLLLNSKETMIRYLYHTERYSGGEIFGNILGNDLRKVSKELKFFKKKQTKAKKKIWRRGPKDKGSRRAISSLVIIEEQRRDKFLQEEQEKIDRKKFHTKLLINKILIILENFEKSEES